MSPTNHNDPLIPFNPWASSTLWYQAWRKQIAGAKAYPEDQEFYCRHATLAQAMYVIHMAFDKVKYMKPTGDPNEMR